tara:strand:- start:670 stop:858 length:189 start_codon:yes stop_codon:yes gene_type:complete
VPRTAPQIAPQMFGAGNVVGVGLTAQRALLTALAFLVPTIPLWIWASEILVALGQPDGDIQP